MVWHYDASAWEEYTATNTVNTTDHRPALMPACIEERFESGNQYMAPFRTVAGYEENARTATSYTDVLLRYGVGELADDPDARTASGFGVFALSDAQDSASFKAVVTDAAETADATILFTNDVHGAGLDPESEGLTYASIAALKYDARTALGTGNVVLVDAGDAVQGDAIAELSEGSVPIEAMGAAGYDLAVPGEHEFDYGTGRFKQLEAQAAELGMTYRSANIDNLAIESGGAFSRLLLNEYGYGMSKFLIDGVPTKVGFVCVTTPEALTASSPSNFQDKNGNTMVSFCEDETGQALYDRVQANIDWLRSDSMGCEYVVAVGHLGNQDVTPRWSSKEVIANTTGIDVFIDGHSHEQVNTQTPDKNGKDVLLVQTGAKLSSIGKLTLDSDGFDVEFITAESYAKKDADVTRALEGYQEEYQEELPETPDEETGDDTDQGSGDAEHEGSGTEPNTPSEDNASSNASLAETGDNPALLLACIAVACAAGIALIAAARRIASPSE